MLFLHVHAADRADANETYDIYVTSRMMEESSGKVLEWDVCHFPQIITTGEKLFAAVVQDNPGVGGPNRVTTAVPGVSSLESGTLQIDTAGAVQGVKTLPAGVIRNGWLGQQLGYYVVIAGTTPSITFSLYAHIHRENP
jgi:hypothetical protein